MFHSLHRPCRYVSASIGLSGVLAYGFRSDSYHGTTTAITSGFLPIERPCPPFRMPCRVIEWLFLMISPNPTNNMAQEPFLTHIILGGVTISDMNCVAAICSSIRPGEISVAVRLAFRHRGVIFSGYDENNGESKRQRVTEPQPLQ